MALQVLPLLVDFNILPNGIYFQASHVPEPFVAMLLGAYLDPFTKGKLITVFVAKPLSER